MNGEPLDAADDARVDDAFCRAKDLRMDLPRGQAQLPRRQQESFVLRNFADLTEAQKASGLGR
jgi:hypothetical protein